MDKKEILLRVILSDYQMSYEFLIYILENSLYVKIYKVPVSIFIFGILQTIEVLTFNGKKIDFTLNDIKELLPEIINETISYELTFTDNDWNDLQILETNRGQILNTKKPYMADFFEI